MHGPMAIGAVKLRYLTLVAFIGLFAVAIALVATGRVKQTFMPEVEGDFMQVSIELPQTTPFSRMEQIAEQLGRRARALRGRDIRIRVRGSQHALDVARGGALVEPRSIDTSIRAYVGLTPPETRTLRSSEITRRLEGLLGEVPDADRVSFSLGGNEGGARVELALMGENSDDLRTAVDELKERLLRFSEVTSVRDSEDAAIEELTFTLLPGAEQLGLTLQDVTRQVRQAYYGEEIQRLPRGGDEVRVFVRYPRDDRRTLKAFRVRTAVGARCRCMRWRIGISARRHWPRPPPAHELDPGGAEPHQRRGAPDIMHAQSGILPDFEAPPNRHGPRHRPGRGSRTMVWLATFGIMALFAMYFLWRWCSALFAAGADHVGVRSRSWAVVGHHIGHQLCDVLYFGRWRWALSNDNVVLLNRANQIRGYFAMRLKRLGQPAPEHESTRKSPGQTARSCDRDRGRNRDRRNPAPRHGDEFRLRARSSCVRPSICAWKRASTVSAASA